MSNSSCIHLVDVSSLEYRPSVDTMCKIFKYLHISKFYTLKIYSQKLDWKDEDNLDYPVKEYSNLSVNKALKIYKDYLVKYPINNPIWMFAEFNNWAHEFANYFEYISSDISGNYSPADFAFTIGKADIPDVKFEDIQITSSFQLQMYGNQMPINFEKYISIISNDNKMTDLLDFLSSINERHKYSIYMSAYY